MSNFFLRLLIGKITLVHLARSVSEFKVWDFWRKTFFETPVIIVEATGEATSSSELLDRTASEYNLSEDIFKKLLIICLKTFWKRNIDQINFKPREQNARKDLGYMRRDIREILFIRAMHAVDCGKSDMSKTSPNVCAWNAYYITILPRRHVT
jgi:hypothetical protein